MAILDKFTVVDLFETRSDSVVTITGNILRFNKQTTEELDFPPFIQILVNKDEKQFAIRVCKENEANAVKFSKPKEEQRGPVKISAPAVVKMIRKMGGWEANETWNFPGACFLDENVILYDLKVAKKPLEYKGR